MVATFGTGVVISCSQNRLEWVKTNLGGHARDDIFNASVISMIETYVSQDNQTIAGPDLKFSCTPDTFQTLKPLQDVEINVLKGEEIEALYPDKRFRNAIGDAHNPKRPRVTVVTAAHGEEIVGMAAASADSSEMYQVGIDVIPNYRNAGIGSTLVSILTNLSWTWGRCLIIRPG